MESNLTSRERGCRSVWALLDPMTSDGRSEKCSMPLRSRLSCCGFRRSQRVERLGLLGQNSQAISRWLVLLPVDTDGT